jgi:hypothetical protein
MTDLLLLPGGYRGDHRRGREHPLHPAPYAPAATRRSDPGQIFRNARSAKPADVAFASSANASSMGCTSTSRRTVTVYVDPARGISTSGRPPPPWSFEGIGAIECSASASAVHPFPGVKQTLRPRRLVRVSAAYPRSSPPLLLIG